MVSSLRWLLANRNYFIIYLTPLLLIALPLVVDTKEAKCGFVMIIMAIFWCTEALPLAITALFPAVLFPMMGIMDSTEVCNQYLKDTTMLFIGGLLVAIAVEKWNLHRRIALRVLLIVGVKPPLLLLGFMAVTAFISMWLCNTATTAMMFPIAQAVLQQLDTSDDELEECKTDSKNNIKKKESYLNGTENQGLPDGTMNQAFELSADDPTLTISDKESKGIIAMKVNTEELKKEKQIQKKHKQLCKALSLSVCYSASIGGLGTLTGTTPNLVMKGQMDELFPQNNNIVNFASWFGFAFPAMIVLLFLCWILLQVVFFGVKFYKNFGCGWNPEEKEEEKRMFQAVSAQHKKLGSMTFAEISISVLFVLLVLLWLTRDPGFISGWATVSFNRNKNFVTDATVAILVSVLMFFFPSELPSLKCDNTEHKTKAHGSPPILDWKTVNQKMPWSIVILLGGGFALAKGSEVSGLSKWLAKSLAPLQSIPPAATVVVLCLLIATFTECTNNAATTTLFLPIVASMAKAIKKNPLYVMLPCTLSAQLAFMLPVATPPNSVVFSYGHLKVIDMVKAGFVLKILGVLTITLAINAWAFQIFDLGTFPSWANVTSLH
ncbi:solute carrier family 13 member 2 [Bombina bombina]|uniref:solute carrier family 13 member 2 n=1 Tax=Bombina bombina TaxID=8345 RepID=UPI00235A52C6|nr:solute carrier family 13 member 2 [Bombina bombina]